MSNVICDTLIVYIFPKKLFYRSHKINAINDKEDNEEKQILFEEN